MDAPLGGRGTGRAPRRGRGGGNNSGNVGNGRGAGSAGGSSSSQFRRKLAGTPLFQPRSDNDDSPDEWPKLTSNLNKGKGSMAKDESLYDSDAEAARRSRFEKTASQNRYLELKPLREKERRDAIAAGLIPDPLKPRRLDEALTLQGVCEEMCPEFEREEREFQKNVDRWEMIPGTNRIDRNRAITAFHRPAAGNEQPMPSDVRPPHILKKTLDYLFHDILAQDPELVDSHPFLRDRTRAIRQDFTLQNERGTLAIECHERIARYHILCLHVLRESENFSESQELEQLRKVLQSLNEFYDDARHDGLECPDEAEFRAYYLITHLRDSDTIRQTELLPLHIFNSQHIQSALRLQSLALRNNESRGERGRRPANSEASLNAFSRFFKQVAKDETSYLLACLGESHFTDIRRGALVAMRKAYIPQQPQYPIAKLAKMLGCNDVHHCAEVVETFGLNVVRGVGSVPVSVELHKQVVLQEYPPVIKQRASRTIVEVKRGRASIQSIIDGEFYSSHVDIASTTKHLAKSTVVPQKGAAILSTRKIASLPVSAPASPAPQPAFTFKPQISATKLNAGANAFTPGKVPAQQPTPLFTGFKPSAFQSPVPAVTSTPPPPTPSVQPIQEPARSPLQPRHVSPIARQQAHSRKISGRHPSITSITQRSPTSATKKTLPIPVPIPSAGKSALNKALPLLLDMLLAEHFESATRLAAVESLTEIHAEHAAVRESERQQVVDKCSAELLDKALNEFAAEKAEFVVAAYYDKKITLRKQVRGWREKLENAKRAREALEERKKRFGSLAKGLSPIRKTRKVVQTEDLPDISMLDLSGAGDAFSRQDQRKPARTSTAVGSATKETFWTPRTLANLICDTVNQTFATFHTSSKPDWKCLVLVDSLDSPIATWYRCKLGIGADEEGSIVMRPHVRVEFALVQQSELGGETLQDVGLAIRNSESEDSEHAVLEGLTDRLRKESQYKAGVLQAIWSGLSDESKPSYKAQAIDTEDSNGGLGQALTNLLQTILANDIRQSGSTARDIVVPFIAVWQAGLQRCVTRITPSSSISRYLLLLERFLGLLRDITDELSDLVLFDDEDAGPLHVPEIDAGQDNDSVTVILQQYLGHPDLKQDISLAFLATNLDTIDDSTLQIETFFQSLADAFLQSYNDGVPEHGISDSDIAGARTWYAEAVDDAVAAFASQLSELTKKAGKKRRRSPPTADGGTSVTAQKRHRDDSPSKEGTDKAPWIPDRISSLADLISQTKALLS